MEIPALKDDRLAYVIKLYNQHVEAMAAAEAEMDNPNPKISSRAGEDFATALSAQKAISETLELLGLELIVNDEDFAVDIQARKEE